ncbi:hypothetical protein FUAX_08900 [Fulvitalea axinellae]|uniref:Putative auto-transporter adhesin head GIN domain-containing protein n=1 Tax=Fulvitalea axinellae TaxID=1182444 RepID=A0AAU9CEZ7_9BACT|nr:hypothetical protein FUAX_08900 [Fulvitalea axinellae]
MRFFEMKTWLSLVLSFFVFACDSSEEEEMSPEETTVETGALATEIISKVDLAMPATLVINQGEKQEVRFEGDAEIVSKIKREVKDGLWEIKLEPGKHEYKELKIFLTIGRLEAVKLSAAASVSVEDFTGEGVLAVGMTGVGNIDFGTLKGYDEIKTSVSSTGKVEFKKAGSAVRLLTADMSGVSKLYALNLVAEKCVVKVKGLGEVKLNVSETLDAEIGDLGKVYYKGTPAITKKVSGNGVLSAI